MGYLPGIYLENIVRKPAKVAEGQKAIEEGRAKTMSDSSGGGSRANSLEDQGKRKGWGVEEFQRGGGNT